jgi:hypothetical protein
MVEFRSPAAVENGRSGSGAMHEELRDQQQRSAAQRNSLDVNLSVTRQEKADNGSRVSASEVDPSITTSYGSSSDWPKTTNQKQLKDSAKQLSRQCDEDNTDLSVFSVHSSCNPIPG